MRTIEIRTIYCGLKFTISALAGVLLIELLFSDKVDLYSTFFIFMADKVLDVYFSDNSYETAKFRLWGTINVIGGVAACLVALAVTFLTVQSSVIVACFIFTWIVKVLFFICITSYLLRDGVQAVYFPLLRKQIINSINSGKKPQKKN